MLSICLTLSLLTFSPSTVNAMSAMLDFVLDIDDGWPPVAKQCMACVRREDGYQVQAPPLFIKNLSVGDVVDVRFGDEGEVVSWTHIARSARSTVWIMVSGDYMVSGALERLKTMGCNVVELEQYRYYAVDVPEECAVERLDECLNAFDNRKVSVAFPSFRH